MDATNTHPDAINFLTPAIVGRRRSDGLLRATDRVSAQVRLLSEDDLGGERRVARVAIDAELLAEILGRVLNERVSWHPLDGDTDPFDSVPLRPRSRFRVVGFELFEATLDNPQPFLDVYVHSPEFLSVDPNTELPDWEPQIAHRVRGYEPPAE